MLLEQTETDSKCKEKWYNFKTEVMWSAVLLHTTWYAILIYSLLDFPFLQHKGLILSAWILADLNLVAVTAGVHRLWSHRSYKAKLPLRLILAFLYYGAGENSIYRWVREHRVHHRFTDTDADPYSVSRGFFYAHVGWLLLRKHPEAIRRWKTIDMSDFEEDRVIATIDRYYIWNMIVCSLFLPVFIPVYFFDQPLQATIVVQIFMRVTYVHHVTFSINSFAHMFGYRSYNRKLSAAENFLVSTFCTGEGWHNYHHAFPWDYKAGEFNTVFFNRATAWINLFSKIGWAYDLLETEADFLHGMVQRKGDGSHPNYSSYDDNDNCVKSE